MGHNYRSLGKKIPYSWLVVVAVLCNIASAQSIDVYEKVYWWDTAETYSTGIGASDSQVASVTYTLPTTDGDPNDVLKTDGDGVLTWTRPWAFVSRDVDAYDWSDTDFTTDATWYDLDCSSIVAAGTELIHIRAYITDGAAASWFNFRKNGNSNAHVVYGGRTQVADVGLEISCVVPCDDDYVIEYRGADLAFTHIYVLVAGYEGYLAYVDPASVTGDTMLFEDGNTMIFEDDNIMLYD